MSVCVKHINLASRQRCFMSVEEEKKCWRLKWNIIREIEISKE